MRRISSRATFFYKRIFPIIFFALLLLLVAFGIFTGLRLGRFPPAPFFIVPVVIIAVVYFVLNKLVFDMVDEVLDAGDALIVRNGGREDRIALAEVMNVSYSPFVNPPRVVLALRRPSVFGTQVAFCAPARFVPFAANPLVDELIQRIDAARRR
jgi:hypothetical protein